ncbi:hypothetical protein N482_10510 [Pseudoalteromonas luteoviolacea NCIMB 1942]|uniref:Uncharacterized protein n=1 Tax=Pseudoalteromonas luteoviolacea NCIMB 1942 TaxID=1365253 RepID=A0A167C7V7_9GAMM|nr:hypothetical protein N482_10510 [Pseudoalteromonas luteoviolacea NCIMB 1942]
MNWLGSQRKGILHLQYNEKKRQQKAGVHSNFTKTWHIAV